MLNNLLSLVYIFNYALFSNTVRYLWDNIWLTSEPKYNLLIIFSITVRYLEEQNQILEEKIAEAKSKRTSVLTDAMKEELIQLRDQVNY